MLLHHIVTWIHICFFISHDEMHLPFHVMGKCMRSVPLTISTNQCIFMWHEEMHLPPCHGEMHEEFPIDHPQPINASSCDVRKCICFFMSWENTLENSHLAISSNQCLFMSHEKIHLPLHLMKNYVQNLPLIILSTLSFGLHTTLLYWWQWLN
jgi:hypothetical protein